MKGYMEYIIFVYLFNSHNHYTTQHTYNRNGSSKASQLKVLVLGQPLVDY